MNYNYNIEYHTKLKVGEGSAKETGTAAKELGITKALLVCDQGILNAGGVTPIMDSLKEAGVGVVLFDKVKADPPDYICNEGGELAHKEGVDGIVAVGGGSSLDTAKAINILLSNPAPINQYFAYDAPAGTHPLIAIPTTAGTGSEVTQGGMVTDTTCNVKKFIPGYATMAIIDPELYVSMPVKPSSYCGFDALSHAVESVITIHSDPVAEMYAKEAITLLTKNLPKLQTESTNLRVRGDLAIATTFAGYAVSRASCHLTHAIGHSLGAVLHIPHGLACALCLPQLFKRYAIWMPEETRTVALAMGFYDAVNMSSEELSVKMSGAMADLLKTCQIPTMKELGYTEQQMLDIVPMMMKDAAMFFAPRKFTEADIAEIISECYNA